ncbi:hypothetical protein TYRP_013557 [Tyrophagus putrescentiae]|nr:hypothetical protein TYRP_013557 [Tyrophagus putrescentiae]
MGQAFYEVDSRPPSQQSGGNGVAVAGASPIATETTNHHLHSYRLPVGRETGVRRLPLLPLPGAIAFSALLLPWPLLPPPRLAMIMTQEVHVTVTKPTHYYYLPPITMSAEQQQIPVEQVSAEEEQQQSSPVGTAPVKATCPSGTACSKGHAQAAPAADQAEEEASPAESAN